MAGALFMARADTTVLWYTIPTRKQERIFANSLVVGFTFAHLRIVSRLRLIENAYVFVFAKRLLFRVQEVGCF